MKKKLIIGCVVILVFAGIIALIYNLNKPKDLVGKTKIVDGVKFSEAKITRGEDKYIFSVKVTTTSECTLNIEDFDAIIYDKNGKIIETITGYLGDINKNSVKEVTIESIENLSEAYEINYTLRFNND